MNMCHFFKRTVRSKVKGAPPQVYLAVSSSSSEGFAPLFASTELLFEATGSKSRMVPRAIKAITARFPHLEAGEPLYPDDKRTTVTQLFDIPFYEKKGSLLSKIIH